MLSAFGEWHHVARGFDDGLIHLSVGIEDADDLQEDLRQALA